MKGFTLVELLVCLLILGVVFTGIYGVLNVGNAGYLTDTSLMLLQQEARKVLHPLNIDLRNAGNPVVTVLDANSDRITFNTYGGTGISYYRDINDANGDGITDQVIREYPAGTRKVLANDITRLKFILVGNVVQAEVVAAKTVRLRPLSFTLKSQIRLRN